MNKEYIRLSEDYKNNILIPATDSPYAHIKNPNKPHFISMLKYDENQYQQWKRTNSLSGMSGGRTNKIWADFDSKNLKEAFLDAQTFVERLIKDGLKQENIQISFSGNKGIGIIVETNQDLTIDEVKAYATKKAEKLKTFDLSMYDHQRIFRLLFTKNEKSGYYKIPLESNDLIFPDIPKIHSWASSIQEYDREQVLGSYKKADVTEKMRESMIVAPAPENKPIVKSNTFDVTTTPKGWKPWVAALAQGFFETGERHNALLVLASRLRGMGFNKEQTYYNCKSALKLQAERTQSDEFAKEELWDNIIERTVFSDKWQGGQYDPKTHPWVKSYVEKMNLVDKDAEEIKVIQLQDVEKAFTDYVVNIKDNTILTGIPRLDEAMPLTIGMNLGVVGAASSGKTAFALSVLKNTSDAGVISVFASLDMHRNRLFEKLLYKVSGLDRNELYERIRTGQAGDIFKKVQQEYKNVYFYDRSMPSVEDIRRYILQVEEQTGKKVKLVMLDYFERVVADKSDETAASKEISGKLQDLVNDFNVCLVTLVQPNKFSLGSGPDQPIMSYTAIKGSSFLYQSFRSIISIWRPFFTPATKEKDKFLQMAILKNDLGELDTFNFGWNGKRGEIWELTQDGEDELEKLLKEKAEEKTNSKDENWV